MLVVVAWIPERIVGHAEVIQKRACGKFWEDGRQSGSNPGDRPSWKCQLPDGPSSDQNQVADPADVSKFPQADLT